MQSSPHKTFSDSGRPRQRSLHHAVDQCIRAPTCPIYGSRRGARAQGMSCFWARVNAGFKTQVHGWHQGFRLDVSGLCQCTVDVLVKVFASTTADGHASNHRNLVLSETFNTYSCMDMCTTGDNNFDAAGLTLTLKPQTVPEAL